MLTRKLCVNQIEALNEKKNKIEVKAAQVEVDFYAASRRLEVVIVYE